MKSVCNTMGIIVPIWNKFLLIHTSMNQITKVDCNAFLSESESIKLKSFVPFGRDSTLVSWIAIVMDWSKHRFRQRLWPVCMRQNQSDFHQFSWSPADFLFSTLESWFYSCQQPANLADIPFHSFWQALTTQRQKNPKNCFHWSKIIYPQPVIGQMFISQLWEKPSYLSEFVQFITNTFLFWQFSLV